MAGNVTITLFWDMTPYTLVDRHQCLGKGADCSTVRAIASSPSKYEAAGNWNIGMNLLNYTVSKNPVFLRNTVQSARYRSYTWEPTSGHIQGQSKKEPNLFNLNLLLYLQLNQTCLLQSTPLYCWYTAPCVFFQFWNASWNVFCGIARRSCGEFSFISSIVWNRRPFKVDFNFGNRKKSAGAKSGE